MCFLKRNLFVLLLFFSVCSFSVVAEDWSAINQKAVSAYQQGNYKKASELAKKALETAQAQYGEKHQKTLTSTGCGRCSM